MDTGTGEARNPKAHDFPHNESINASHGRYQYEVIAVLGPSGNQWSTRITIQTRGRLDADEVIERAGRVFRTLSGEGMEYRSRIRGYGDDPEPTFLIIAASRNQP